MNRSFRSSPVVTTLVAAALALATIAFANLGTATDPDLGDHLVTEEGFVLYVFLPDEQGPSTCTGDCAAAWPPLVADAEVHASDALDAEQIGTVERDDGSMQVTYFGWPLYTFVRDSEAGMASGQGVGGNWYVIAPDGTVVGADMGDSMSSDGSEEVAMTQDEYDALYRDGIRAYRSVCASCHGRDGDQSLAAHVKLLNENDNLADVGFVINQIVNGNGYMPGFGAALDDRQVAGIATYIRGSWGNDYGPVREEAVADYR